MRNKLVAVIVAALLAVAFASTAFAGTFSDVPSDKPYYGAVERLAGLGVVQGVGGGKYDPESTYTRAQFAALVVKLRGIKNPAKGATDFSDVPGDHWASGWINLASGLGIIKGMGDGTFHPDDPVTHAQALTMLLRAMGYEPSIKKGPWPAIVLARAAELELDKGVNVVANLPATRGEVAMFADNALTQPLMVLDTVTEDGREIYKKDATKSIATTYLKTTTAEGILIDSPENLANTNKKYVSLSTSGNTNIELVSGTRYSGLLGHKVKVWKNSDGKAYFIEDKTEPSQVLSVKAGDIIDSEGNVTKVKVGSTEYSLDDFDNGTAGNQIYYIKDYSLSGAAVPTGDLDQSSDVDNGKFIAILNDDNKVQAIVATKSKHAIVDSVSGANESITCTSDTGFVCPGSLKDKTVTWSGAAAKVADLQKGDVLEWVSANDKYVIVVTRNAKSGTLSKIYADSVEVGGTKYGVAKHTVVSGWDDNSNLNKNVTVYLDQFGKFIKLEVGTVTGPSGNPVGVVISGSITGPEFGVYTHKLRILKSDGTRVDLTIVKDAVYAAGRNADGTLSVSATFDEKVKTDSNNNGIDDALDGKGIKKGAAVEYVLNSDGKIEKIITLADTTTTGTITVAKDPARVNPGSNADGSDGTQASTTYALTSNTIVFDIQDANTDNWKVIQASNLTNDNSVTGKVVRDKDNTALARIVVVTDGYDAGSAADKYGLIMGRYTVSGPKCYYIMNDAGTISDIEALNSTCDVSNAVDDQVYGKDQVLKFRVVGNKFDGANTALADEDTPMSGGAKIWQIDLANNIIKVDPNGDGNTADLKTYLIFGSGDVPTRYYNLKGDADAVAITVNDLAVGDKVSVWTDGTDDSVARVVVIDR